MGHPDHVSEFHHRCDHLLVGQGGILKCPSLYTSDTIIRPPSGAMMGVGPCPGWEGPGKLARGDNPPPQRSYSLQGDANETSNGVG